MLPIDDDEPINNQGAQNTLAFIKSKNCSKCAINLHNRIAFNGNLLNQHLSTFKQSEKNRPAIIWTPETKFVVGSAEPKRNDKYFTDTLQSPHRQYWKEAINNLYNKNTNVALCSLHFRQKILPPHPKIYKPLLCPSTKIKDVMQKYCDLRRRLCQNGK